jgi:hypothetical protein
MAKAPKKKDASTPKGVMWRPSSDEVYEAAQVLAAATGQSLNSFITTAVAAYANTPQFRSQYQTQQVRSTEAIKTLSASEQAIKDLEG